MESEVAAVLASYPDWVRLASVEPCDHLGGYSGARIFRLSTATGPLCLRGAAPAETFTHLTWRHSLMVAARQSGLEVVPALLPLRSGQTAIQGTTRCWELMQWMPGVADFHDKPTAERLRQASRTLARIHLALQPWALRGEVDCPGVLRRREAVSPTRQRGIATPSLARRDHPLMERLRRERDFWLPKVAGLLADAPRVGIQPVLRDIWHDHLLFVGDELTGVVDYASMMIDSVAVDVARMLGSLVEDDEEAWEIALEGYRAVCPLSLDEERLARVLDRTGLILSLGKWLGWLERGERDWGQSHVRGRVERLLSRVERWR